MKSMIIIKPWISDYKEKGTPVGEEPYGRNVSEAQGKAINSAL
jgi:hypothetical protein